LENSNISLSKSESASPDELEESDPCPTETSSGISISEILVGHSSDAIEVSDPSVVLLHQSEPKISAQESSLVDSSVSPSESLFKPWVDDCKLDDKEDISDSKLDWPESFDSNAKSRNCFLSLEMRQRIQSSYSRRSLV
jgi:hypothetical protein